VTAVASWLDLLQPIVEAGRALDCSIRDRCGPLVARIDADRGLRDLPPPADPTTGRRRYPDWRAVRNDAIDLLAHSASALRHLEAELTALEPNGDLPSGLRRADVLHGDLVRFLARAGHIQRRWGFVLGRVRVGLRWHRRRLGALNARLHVALCELGDLPGDRRLSDELLTAEEALLGALALCTLDDEELSPSIRRSLQLDELLPPLEARLKDLEWEVRTRRSEPQKPPTLQIVAFEPAEQPQEPPTRRSDAFEPAEPEINELLCDDLEEVSPAPTPAPPPPAEPSAPIPMVGTRPPQLDFSTSTAARIESLEQQCWRSDDPLRTRVTDAFDLVRHDWRVGPLVARLDQLIGELDLLAVWLEIPEFTDDDAEVSVHWKVAREAPSGLRRLEEALGCWWG